MKQNRYIYHYNCQNFKGQRWSGIAQLTFRIINQDDLERFKCILEEKWGEPVNAVLSLSYLGREDE